MTPTKLLIGTKLKGRASNTVREIQDFAPATTLTVRQWQVNGTWFNFAQLDARYTLHNPTGRAPQNKKEVAAA